MSDQPVYVHIAHSHKREDIPPMGEGKKCDVEGCDPKEWIVNHGLAGGGFGVYSYCDRCGRVVEKDEEPQ